MDYWSFKQQQTARDKRMNEVNIQVTATYGSKWDINNVNKIKNFIIIIIYSCENVHSVFSEQLSVFLMG